MTSSMGVNYKIQFLISKLYVWSIILESFLYFIFLHQSVSIVGIGLSRILQVIVILYLLTKIFNRHLINVVNPFSLFNSKFSLYFLYMIAVSVFGFVIYEYDLNDVHRTKAINRQLFEFVVQLYYFFYFAALPRFFIRNKKGVDYFFKVFFITFFLTVCLGVVDLLSVYFLGENLISRHIYDGVSVGFRFHGINGEPRDAYVYLVLSVSIFVMYGIWKQQKISKILIVLITFLIILTQSMSFIIGLLIFAALIPLYFARYNGLKKNASILFWYFVFLSLMFYVASFSSRLEIYFDAFPNLFSNLNQGLYTEGILHHQMVNIIPVWDLWLKLYNFNPIPLLFGHGIGSSSVVNNAYLMVIWGDTEYGVLNPHAQIIRSIFEVGIVGIVLFISVFFSPFKKRLIRNEEYKKFIFSMLLVLAAFFSHRAVAPYILFGIASVIFPLLRNQSTYKENHSKIFEPK